LNKVSNRTLSHSPLYSLLCTWDTVYYNYHRVLKANITKLLGNICLQFTVLLVCGPGRVWAFTLIQRKLVTLDRGSTTWWCPNNKYSVYHWKTHHQFKV